MTALALAAAAAGGGTANAGPPYVTDDPQPTDTGRWEIYGFGSDTVFRRSVAGGSGLDINYGGARDLQLSAVISAAYRTLTGASTTAGLADLALGAKYRFLHQRDGSWVPDVALFPKITLPTGDRRFGSGRVGVSIPLWAERDVDGWSVFGGGGWTLNPGPGNRSYGFGGAAVTRQVAKRLLLGAEIYHQGASAVDARASTGLGIGASWQVAKRWSIIASGGPLIQHRATAGEYAAYVAIAFHD